LALGYKQLMRVEQCWHTVKGGLRTRPICDVASPKLDAFIATPSRRESPAGLAMQRLDPSAVRAIVVVVVDLPLLQWVFRGIGVVLRNLCHVVALQNEEHSGAYTICKRRTGAITGCPPETGSQIGMTYGHQQDFA
jgi:hypothetical protein